MALCLEPPKELEQSNGGTVYVIIPYTDTDTNNRSLTRWLIKNKSLI
jgi:hypothetical protein